MTVSVTASLPRTVYRNIGDETLTAVTVPVENLPIHLPLFHVMSSWGAEDRAYYCDMAVGQALFGSDLIDPYSPYFTHQTQFLRSTFQAGGLALVKKVAAPNASASNMRLTLERVVDDLIVYERGSDNKYKLDANGERIDTGTTIEGTRLRWALKPITTDQSTGDLTFGTAGESEGTMVSAKDGSVGTVTPIFDAIARCRGKGGRLRGIRLFAPTVNSSIPADSDLNTALGAFLYQIQLVERSTENSTARTKRTLQAADSLPISFKKNLIDLETKTRYYAGKVILPAYENRDPASFSGYGAFEKVSVYDNFVTTVLKELAEAEAAHTGVEIADEHLINFLTGVDVDGVPYHTFVVEGPQDGGLMFSELTNHFMVGGSDGDLGQAAYNALMDTELDGLADSNVPYRNIARMPYSAVYDTGFPTATKLKYSNFLSLRPDVMVHVCTQDVLRPINTPSQDSSIGITLRSHFRSFQESREFGTKACRVVVMSNAGYLINDDYDGLVPFLENLAIKETEYMGAEGGAMNSANSFGRGEENVITRYIDHNVADKPDDARNTDWNNGLNYAEWYDMTGITNYGLQSIYEEHTSILHSFINVYIACNLTRIGNITWRELSGDSKLTDDQFLDEVVKRVNQRATADKYDNRVDITPNAYYTAQDTALGTHWHLDIGMAGDNIRTTEILAIIAQDRRNVVEAQ